MIFRLLLVVYALVVTLMISCKGGSEEAKPAGLVSEEKLAEVLTDIRLLEGVYAGDFQRVDTSEYAIGAYYEQLFSKHQLSRASFMDSYTYYAQHPEMMMRVETEVSLKLEGMAVPAAQ
jgi:hypothetical protein